MVYCLDFRVSSFPFRQKQILLLLLLLCLFLLLLCSQTIVFKSIIWFILRSIFHFGRCNNFPRFFLFLRFSLNLWALSFFLSLSGLFASSNCFYLFLTHFISRTIHKILKLCVSRQCLVQTNNRKKKRTTVFRVPGKFKITYTK